MKDSFFNILKNKIKSLKSHEEYGSLYKWGFFYIIMTYLYPILYCITIPNYRDVADWDIIGQTINDLQNSEIGRRIPLIFLAVPIILLIGSIVTVLKSKCTDRKQFLNVAKMIKYALIPYYILGVVLMIFLILMIFTPVVIMIFLTPVAITIMCIMGWFSMAGTAPFIIAYLKRGEIDNAHNKTFSTLITVMQFFFGVDVAGTVICSLKEKGVNSLTRMFGNNNTNNNYYNTNNHITDNSNDNNNIQ